MTMIERVARAMFNASGEEYGAKWAMNPDNRAQWKALARAAIGAMREPSGDMVSRGEQAMFGHYEFATPRTLLTVGDGWRAMIDEALRDAPQG